MDEHMPNGSAKSIFMGKHTQTLCWPTGIQVCRAAFLVIFSHNQVNYL